MLVEIPYGKEMVDIEFDVPYEVLLPNRVELSDEYTLIKEALRKPYGDVKFFDFIDNAEKLLVIVNDATRPTPTAKIIDFLLPVFLDHPNVRFLIATGVHRAPTEEELTTLVGSPALDAAKKHLVDVWAVLLHSPGAGQDGTAHLETIESVVQRWDLDHAASCRCWRGSSAAESRIEVRPCSRAGMPTRSPGSSAPRFTTRGRTTSP